METMNEKKELPEEVKKYLSERGRIAGQAGTGKSKVRGDSGYYKKIRAAREEKKLKFTKGEI
jgi:hypothetical protein